MKKYLCFITLLCLGLTVSGQNQFVLSGTLKGAPDNTYVKLNYISSDNKNIADSTLLANGAFTLKGTMTEPTAATLVVGKKYAQVYLEPQQMTFSANADLTDVKLTGSKTNDENLQLQAGKDAFNMEFKPVSDKINAVNAALRSAKQNNKPQTTIDSLNDKLLLVQKERGPFVEKYEQLIRQYVLTHPQSAVSAHEMTIYANTWSIDEVKKIYNGFSASLQNSKDGRIVKKAIDERELQQAGLAKDFTAMSLNGKPFTLSSLRGKYVLLDFWGSWCLPCRAEMPHGKELYSKYHNSGLEIVAVAVEHDTNKEAAWKRAVKQDGTGIWHNVLQKEDTKGLPGNITGLYSISIFPTKILIDKAGNVIGRYDGGGTEELDKKLAEIFKAG